MTGKSPWTIIKLWLYCNEYGFLFVTGESKFPNFQCVQVFVLNGRKKKEGKKLEKEKEKKKAEI